MRQIRDCFRSNPYLEAFQKVDAVRCYNEAIRNGGNFEGKDYWHWLALANAARGPLWRRFAYAVPNGEALEALAACGPVIEIGAGSGFWASLLRQGGVEVLAYDKYALGANAAGASLNEYFAADAEPWTQIEKGSDNVVRKHPNHTLFLCCPPPGEPLALNCLNQFRGKRVAVIGDVSYCATVEFYQKLHLEWELEEEVALPRFPNYDDSLSIYRRP
jgi:hypothetical protein